MDSFSFLYHYIYYNNITKNMDRTNIITEGWPKDNEILLDEISCKYIQEPDCTEDRDGDPQEITLSSRDGGGGKFIHIKTNGWSICGDDFEMDLIPLIKDFKWRMDEVFDNSGFAREKVLENSNS
jgi:hypothetical protein